jgi:hexosaminidase
LEKITMKKCFTLLPLAMLFSSAFAADSVTTGTHPALIPAPASIEWRSGTLSKDAVPRVVHIAVIPEEGYELEIATTGALIRSSSDAGTFYAQQTLKQLRGADGSLPCALVLDAPRFAWRGFMLDSSRHFQTVEEIKRYLDLLAMHKLNVFHWHLVDDHGWRFESKKYPLLTQVGAWREQPPIGRYGGFYTQQEMRDVVAYAAKLHITVLPEIEMPGHSRAALAAYPNLACGGTKTEVDHFFAFPMRATRFPNVPGNNVLCAGKEETFKMLEDVLTEVMEIFTSTYIHVGGDEVDMKYWNNCADCQATLKTKQLSNGHKLQAYFMGRIETFLTAHGRKMIGWDEILEGGLTPAATVMSWRGTAGGIKAAKAGHDAVMSPGKPLYFDHRQSSSPQHPPGFGGSVETLQEVYSYDPVPNTLTAEEAKHILGTQANLWSCATETTERLDLFAFPRLCALAEIAWCAPAPKDFSKFQQRLDKHLLRLDALGVNYWKEVGHFQAGAWSPNPAFKLGTSFDLPVTELLDPGKWAVTYNYQKGADALRIEAVELLADNVVVSRDIHAGTAGAQHINHQYTLDVPKVNVGTKWVLRTKANVEPWRGGGNGDSSGVVSMSQAASVRLYAPENPLPVIRTTTPVTQNRDKANYDWATRHQLVLDQIKKNSPEIVMIGDSITHYWAGEPVAPFVRSPEGWKLAFGDRVVANLGFGWDRTENVLWRIKNGELDAIKPKAVVVAIGTNNLGVDTTEDILAGIDAICRKIHEKLPETRILLLGILPRKDQDKQKASLEKVNHLLQTQLHPRSYIEVMDFGNLFRNPDGSFNDNLFSDGLHPNAAGYEVLGKALSTLVCEAMK